MVLSSCMAHAPAWSASSGERVALGVWEAHAPPPSPLAVLHPWLRAQDYHWWWRSYFTSGSSALYLFLYSMFYFYTKLDITKLVPAMMYFGEGGAVAWGPGAMLLGLAG